MDSVTDNLKISQAIIRIARLLSKSKGLDAAVDHMMKEFTEIADADEGSIQLLRPSSTTTQATLVRKGTEDNRLLDNQLNDFLAGCVLNQKHAFISHDLRALLNLKKLPNRYLNINSILSAPLITNKKTIGVVNLVRYATSRPFTDADQQMAALLSEQVGDFIENAELREKLFNENKRLQINLQDRFSVHGIIGSSPAMNAVFDLLERIIPTDARVVLEGESGTGKELVSKCIHYAGPRRDKAFVAVDCGTLPPNLLESELFGYVKGAFTGAMRDRIGLIEEAHEGTLFLDEFTNMSLETQAKLLRVIQEGEIRPLGSNQLKKIDVRIIVAASSNLKKMVESGKVRSDLFYRLNVLTVQIPPLRERVQDIPELAKHFLKKYASKHKKALRDIAPEAYQILQCNSWPGNIRELENVIERAAVMTNFDETVLLPESLPQELTTATPKPNQAADFDEKGDLPSLLAHYERDVLQRTLTTHNWNQSAAAEELNISEAVMRYKIKRLRLKKN